MNTAATTDSAPRRFALALVGLALTLAAPGVYLFTMDDPVARVNGWPAYAADVVGLLLAFFALRQDARIRVRLVFYVAAASVALWILGFAVLSRLPQSPDFAALAKAPDVALPDHQGRTVSLAEARAAGPVLLVFFRGKW